MIPVVDWLADLSLADQIAGGALVVGVIRVTQKLLSKRVQGPLKRRQAFKHRKSLTLRLLGARPDELPIIKRRVRRVLEEYPEFPDLDNVKDLVDKAIDFESGAGNMHGGFGCPLLFLLLPLFVLVVYPVLFLLFWAAHFIRWIVEWSLRLVALCALLSWSLPTLVVVVALIYAGLRVAANSVTE